MTRLDAQRAQTRLFAVERWLDNRPGLAADLDQMASEREAIAVGMKRPGRSTMAPRVLLDTGCVHVHKQSRVGNEGSGKSSYRKPL